MGTVHDSERAGPQREVEPEVQRYFRILIERRLAIFMALCVGGVLFAYWAVRQPKIYSATATIIVDASPPQVMGAEVRDVVQVGPGQFYAMQDYIQTQKRVLTSDRLGRKVVERLNLLSDHEFWGGTPPATLEQAAQAF